jgi:hypothetical protein
MMTWGCASAPPPSASEPQPPPPAKRELAVIPAESDAFPAAARAVSEQLAQAKVAGIDETRLSKVSLEVVQLAIECVEPTGTCYQAIGRSLAANELLFARIVDSGPGAGAKKRAGKRPLKVSVTLFDVDAKSAARTAEREFASEADATAGAAALVQEVTR